MAGATFGLIGGPVGVVVGAAIGGAAGATVFGALVYALMPSIDITMLGRTATDMPIPSVTHAFHVAFVVAALVAAIAAFAASRVPAVPLWQPRTATSITENVQAV